VQSCFPIVLLPFSVHITMNRFEIELSRPQHSRISIYTCKWKYGDLKKDTNFGFSGYHADFH